MEQSVIWTIGHSTRTFEKFISILRSFGIEVVADIRSYPGSKRYPHFNKAALEISLPENNLRYQHFPGLGGRRKPLADSPNKAWKVEAFRGYADYMQTDEFLNAIKLLEKLALKNRVVYMCSEAVWWSCHRSLVSDYLKFKSWKVMHIMEVDKAEEHPYTKPAITNGEKLAY